MSEVITLEQPDICFRYSEFLPNVVRVLEAGYEVDSHFRVQHVATVYGNSFEATLTWVSACPDERITKGALARVYWPNTLSEADGLYSVIRLVPLTRVDHSVNLFETVPPTWTREYSLLDRAKELWSQMSESQQRFFNEIFWDVRLFWRYICAPASINSHHNGWGGNLRHVVELAEHAERISLEVEGVSVSLLILASLLYNAGQTQAFVWKDGQWGFQESKIRECQSQFQQRLDAVLDQHPSLLSTQERHILWQTLFGQHGSRREDYRQPMASLETEILKMADRLSCVINLQGQGGVQ